MGRKITGQKKTKEAVEHRFYFRIELSGTGKTKEEAYENAVESFVQDPGTPPDMVIDGFGGRTPDGDGPIVGTPHTVDDGPDED